MLRSSSSGLGVGPNVLEEILCGGTVRLVGLHDRSNNPDNLATHRDRSCARAQTNDRQRLSSR